MPDDTESNFAYDVNGRLAEMSFNGKPPVTIQYDTGTVIVTNTADQATQRSYYDDKGNFVEYQDSLGHTTLSDYDDNHNLTGIVLPDGNISSYSYDTKGNLVGLADQLQQITSEVGWAEERSPTISIR
ncbi:MAG: hypothetical protein AB1461_19985 [Thermodesulfobacteriota bacterium]